MIRELFLNNVSEDEKKSRLFTILYLLISVCVSLTAAGLYGRIFKLDVIYRQPGIPNFVDYIFEGVNIYFITDFIILAGSTAFLFFFKKKKISFCLCWVLFNLVISIIGLFAAAGCVM